MDNSMISANTTDYGTVKVKPGTSLKELAEHTGIKEDPLIPVVGALYNNRVMGLEYRLKRDCSVKFITTDTTEGADIYRKSLSVLLHAAFIDVSGKEAPLKIEHSLSKGYFYSCKDRSPISRECVQNLKKRMDQLVSKDIPFHKQEMEKEDAMILFEKIGAWDRYYLLKYSDRSRVILYRMEKCINLAQGPLVPSTGYLKLFSLIHYSPGLVLLFPQVGEPGKLPQFIEQKKLHQIYSEHREWSRILDVDSAGKLNRMIVDGKINDLIWVTEGLHEKKIAQIADIITRNSDHKRIILLAGPSSSGKTTFAKRLTIQLLANGISPQVISLDNYFVPRDHMPRGENGEIDFDSLHALDLDLINDHLKNLLEGRSITVPKYDFKTGERTLNNKTLHIRKNQIVIIEGIHGMNENLTRVINREQKYKIYISALTQLNIDVINRIPTSTVRLMRRIARDYQFRSYTAAQTIAQWPLVRRGEDRNIFPFQEEADIMFNSSLVYEMSVLKAYVEPLLKRIDEKDPLYTEARQLLHFASNFLHIIPEHVPFTSILREFIGGSGFHY
ncbi:MAG: nucleoside kinase [Spirochaetota bacterium]